MRTLAMGIGMGILSASALASAEPMSFGIMDRQDETSRAGGELSYLFLGGLLNGDAHLFRADVHGQYVDPGVGIGGYLTMPFAHVSSSSGGMSQSATGIGDAELGGIYVGHIQPGSEIVVHGGLTLPTGSKDSDAAVANVIGAFARLTDFYLAIPHGVTMRLGVSPIVQSGPLTLRFDVGLDVNLSSDSSGSIDNSVDNLFHLNVGLGYRQGNVGVTAELVNVRASGSGSESENWINVAGLSARLFLNDLTPYLAITFPVDHDSNQILDAVATVGVETRLR